jgi:hypothetical protein
MLQVSMSDGYENKYVWVLGKSRDTMFGVVMCARVVYLLQHFIRNLISYTTCCRTWKLKEAIHNM